MGDPFRVDIVVWGEQPGVQSTLGYQEETLSASGCLCNPSPLIVVSETYTDSVKIPLSLLGKNHV